MQISTWWPRRRPSSSRVPSRRICEASKPRGSLIRPRRTTQTRQSKSMSTMSSTWWIIWSSRIRSESSKSVRSKKVSMSVPTIKIQLPGHHLFKKTAAQLGLVQSKMTLKRTYQPQRLRFSHLRWAGSLQTTIIWRRSSSERNRTMIISPSDSQKPLI